MDENDFVPEDGQFIFDHQNNPQDIIDANEKGIDKLYPHMDENNKIILKVKGLIASFIYASLLQKIPLAQAIKDHVVDTYTLTANEFKTLVQDIISNANVKTRLAAIINNIDTTESVKRNTSMKNKTLDEATIYSHKTESDFEIPDSINIVSQKQVEDFISEVAPEELFKVGYITPVYFYTELNKVFNLVKATELEGYTGLDYRDASVNAADHDARLANAQRQIDTYQDGVLDKESGHKLNAEGEKFSTMYRQTNKLSLNAEKANELYELEYEVDADGNPVLDVNGQPVIKRDANGQPVQKKVMDLSKILFYPRVGSKPKVTYYLDLHDGKGFNVVSRDILTNVLYQRVLEAAVIKDAPTIEKETTKAGIKYIKEIGFNTLQDFMDAYPGLSVSDYKLCMEKGYDPKTYLKQFPYSRRWSMGQFEAKVRKTIEQDNATISTQALDATKGYNRQTVGTGLGQHLSQLEDKPQVRALYTNQIYYISGKPGTYGKVINEGLEEEIDLQEAKRYVKRYYVRPQNIFCSNKEDILKALLRVNGENCSIYSLKDLPDHDDVHLLKPSDIIYYYDDGILYDKNHVKVMDYDLNVKHEEERKKFANADAAPASAFADAYDDRLTDADLKDKEAVANFKAINQPEIKEEVELTEAVEFKDIEAKKSFNRLWKDRFNELLAGKKIAEAKQTKYSYSLQPMTVEKVFIGANTGNLIIKCAGHQYSLKDFKEYHSAKPHIECYDDEGLNLQILSLIEAYNADYNEAAKVSNGRGRSEEHKIKRAKKTAEAVLGSQNCEAVKAWLAEHITSIHFKLPICSDPGDVVLDDTLSPEDFEKLAEKWQDSTDRFLALWKPALVEGEDFNYRDAVTEPESVSAWYKFRGPACTIEFDCAIESSEVPAEVTEMIALAKQESEENSISGRDINYDVKGNKLDSYYTGRALGEIFGYDINFYKKPAAPVEEKEPENPFEQDFDNYDVYGDKVESLREAKENTCCICGEPIVGYGNNAEPYKSGRCCDACNRKFVIPARLQANLDAMVGDEE